MTGQVCLMVASRAIPMRGKPSDVVASDSLPHGFVTQLAWGEIVSSEDPPCPEVMDRAHCASLFSYTRDYFPDLEKGGRWGISSPLGKQVPSICPSLACHPLKNECGAEVKIWVC